MTPPSLIAFGALAPWPASDRLDQLRNALQHHKCLESIVKAFQELPLLWRALSSQDPTLNSIAGEAAADHLTQWITGTGVAQIAEDKDNITRMPLTTTAQIVDYISYLRHRDEPLGHESVMKSVAAGGGVQGFCIGLLSALAVASGTTEDDVGRFAADSVRLAFCIGAYVDVDRHLNGDDFKASTLAIRWKSPTTLEDIQRLLSRYPDTYIAVIRDVKDVTATVPASVVERLLEDLSQVGASVRDTGVSGRYHIPIHEGVPRKILETCQAQFSPIIDGQSLVRSNTDACLFSGDNTALLALECILGECADWYSTISTAASALKKIRANPFILSIGNDAVPQSVVRSFPVVKSTMIADRVNGIVESKMPAPAPDHEALVVQGYPKDAIAIIGMGCRFPGADSIDEFWDLLTEGKSMLSEIPEARFGRGRPARSNDSLRFWGNFLRDMEAFDHGFFKKSPREAVFMDPQQRLLLQIAYEALEMSGYFAESSRPQDVGCYIGACATDYDFNVASHPPTAYSATGTLRSFLSGKLSHYFGWSGPSLVLDTACSSSAVAIHTACTALRTSQCSLALAGGITLMTSPYLYENFAAAHFLSPTGGSKPFSADADGYCRGEGGGLVVLKRLSDAFRDNDRIIGVIAGSAVNQNANCVPITVPHTSSQGNLYERVTEQAGVTPNKVTFVEAHGTGTPVGDPIEMESIRRIFGGPEREAPLIVSSAKGNIGHLEGASGVAALIKAILQMENRLAPRQALFKTLNPKIPALEPDNLYIPTSNVALSGGRMVACVNNYGAAGSNAALIILEAPCKGVTPQTDSETSISSRPKKFPIQLAAASPGSLLAYCKALDKFCGQLRCARDLTEHSQILSDLAFNLATRLNQELSFTFTTTATDLDHLHAQLRQKIAASDAITQRPKEPPVVLCFGGQTSDKVALDKCLWQESTLFRSNLDNCDSTLHAMGYPGIYPGIFQREAVTDVVVLHSIIFATQYSCARAWLESGLKVNALIGHSFGQLTALCISGMLSLRDGLKLVAGRASLMQKYWGSESGTMIAVETDQQTLEELQMATHASNASYSFEIACFNGPTSHVAVSDKASAGELETKLTERAIRYRRLDVPYGFHSRFTEPLLPHLEDLASSLTFHEPNIPLETCTDTSSWAMPTAESISAHTREPVFFGQAVQRLQAKLGPCTWLEAGSDSSVVSMVRRALGQSSAATDNFVPLQLNKPNSTELVVDATTALWTAGHRAQFWNFHRSQRAQYHYLRLPPYAWEKNKHWLDLEMSAALPSNNKTEMPPTAKLELPPVLIHLESVDSRGHHFIIDPSSEEYQNAVKDLESLGSPVCPSALYIELASRAVRMADKDEGNDLLSIREFQVHSLLGPNLHQTVSLDLLRLAQGWRFRVTSADGSSDSSKLGELICHAEGTIYLKTADSSLDDEFCRYERLTGHDKIVSIAEDPRSESLRGNVMYKMLARAVNYPEWYRGVKSVAAVDSRLVARVTRPAGIPEIVSKNITTQLPILESFIQVASLHANCLHECIGGAVYQFARADYLQWAPGFELRGHGNSVEGPWDVMAYTTTTAGEVAYDMFIYDVVTARLVLLILGVHFMDLRQPVTIPAGLNTNLAPALDMPTLANANAERAETGATGQPLAVPQLQAKPNKPGKDAKRCIYEDICDLLEKLADIPKDQVPGDASFDDIGVDSLMMIEVISELSTLFRVELPVDELEELTDFNSLVNYLHGKGCVGTSFVEDGDSSSSSSSSQTPSTGTSSPPDSSGSNAMTTPPGSLKLVDEADSIGAKSKAYAVPAMSNGTGIQPLDLGPYGVQDVFMRLRFDFEKYAEQTGAKGFWTNVYPQQADLVCSYVVDAYRKLGCDLASLPAGQQLPSMNTLPRHKHLVAQLRNILVDSGYLEVGSNQAHVRTAKPSDSTPTAIRYERMLQRHPLYASETKLLHVIGSRLADCLIGKAEPLSLLFGDKHNRELLADFYSSSQMLKAVTRLLAEFVSSVFSATQSEGTLYILEVGAGTGGTTKYLVDFLTRCGVSFEYTFTDISMALVSQAKRNFSSFPQMRFMTFDCDRPAPQELRQKFHIVISTNCIHATSNLTVSTANILPTLREDGALCLLEFTKNLYWFDLVFGLLEGWWLFSDGRQHALAKESFWNSSLRAAGFKHVSYTDGNTEEAKTLRLICGFKGEAKKAGNLTQTNGTTITKRAGVPLEEVVWKRVGALELSADIYFPKTPDPPGKKRPLALLIHGGGHFLFGRKDVPMKHIRTLIERGFLPISTDYRLVPETTLFEGPMTDCCDALKWATETLPTLSLNGPTVRPDPTKVVSFGWSSGGQLSMSLGYAAPAKGIKAPDAIFALYPPSDMGSDHWHKPCYPLAAEEEPAEVTDILAGVKDHPIVEYAPISEKRTMALSLTLKDDRAKIILHMCWESQTVPILVHGLPHKDSVPATDNTDWRYPPAASVEQVQAISPLWQIRQGNYKTPTFMVHGNGDDWLPLSMSERTIKELKDRGIPAKLSVPERCGHAFDLFPVGDPLGVGWTAIEEGYEFICSQLGMN